MSNNYKPASQLRSIWPPSVSIAALGLTGVMALTLHLMGRSLWCQGGTLSPWSWDIWSMHNSQHLLDPYTFTHVLHGILFYGILWAAFQSRWPAARTLLALTIEAAWELAENTNTVIESYRETTISLNYYGDSILNSVADLAAFALGYTAAVSLPVWVSVLGFVWVETALILTIRDSLLVNVLMLVHPVEAVKTWQMGG